MSAARRQHRERGTTEKRLPHLPYNERSGPSPTDDTPISRGERSNTSWSTGSNPVSTKPGQFHERASGPNRRSWLRRVKIQGIRRLSVKY